MTKTTVSPSQAYISPTSVAPVLIGFDGSDRGRDALELGRVLAAARGTRCLVAVPADGAFADEARGVLGDPDAEVAAIGTRSVGEMLVDRAEREHAGTLVIGSSHRGAVGRTLLGSVAGHALDEAPCEVVVAPAGYHSEHHTGLGKIAVAVNGSEESKVALTRAEDLAREAGATIEVIVAEDPEVSGIEAEIPLQAPPVLGDVLGRRSPPSTRRSPPRARGSTPAGGRSSTRSPPPWRRPATPTSTSSSPAAGAR